MNAREKFRIGMKVWLTELGWTRLHLRRPFGVVVGFSRSPVCVLVQRDALKAPERFHMDFWEPRT